MGSLGYYSSDLMEDEYRCTVVILTPSHVLGTSLCISSTNNIRLNPHLVLLNTTDNEGLELEVKVLISYMYILVKVQVYKYS